jgi:hypothetical protein
VAYERAEHGCLHCEILALINKRGRATPLSADDRTMFMVDLMGALADLLATVPDRESRTAHFDARVDNFPELMVQAEERRARAKAAGHLSLPTSRH